MKQKFVISLILLSLQVTMSFSQRTTTFTERELEIIGHETGESVFRILQTTDPVDSLILRMPSTDMADPDSIADDKNLQLLIERLRITMEQAGGVGIAAPQVGVLKNVFLFMRVDLPGKPLQVVINPRMVAHSAETVCFERDGCLSIPDTSGNSIRYPWIEVEFWDEKGDFHRERLEGYHRGDNFAAVIFQHEFDHLQGIFFTDKNCLLEEEIWK
ncbi:MAG: peptide deformylase [Proteiniphilum sp.]|jgi:peptide deformylase|nr:peptide deformylase [Proteiniphilum sp.]MDD2938428.1 peptide deformylase [Proteiniphilum sp.]MDD3956542.1 peptide deformylase [Proteiniphilum sp.]MDD4452286.1 peptide deformylase [Proteiniphilum sp.]